MNGAMQTVISVENLGKKYRLQHQERDQFRTFRDVVAENVKRAGKRISHPFGEPKAGKVSQEDFWALQDVSFAVGQGERVGIIGRNGAGKSTLLKILSRITEPTTGRVRLRGRVASLLEVGTGFHPELTGRENIFLNGAILGMGRQEIRRKFDEIVAFAEIEKFLDTPVKRYSSGMYVRLAFAVAAHLEPDILIIDEVLSVGDAQFQNKCLGKINEVAYEGRTILLVSHNMPAIISLCNKAIYLKEGKVHASGQTSDVVELYSSREFSSCGKVLDVSGCERSAGKERVIKTAWIEDENGNITNSIMMGNAIKIYFKFESNKELNSPVLGFGFEDGNAQRIFSINNSVVCNVDLENTKEGIAECYITELPLQPGEYTVSLSVVQNQSEWVDFVEKALVFTVLPNDVYGTGKLFDKTQGIIYVRGKVVLNKKL